jgi:hypothetical protein
MACGMTWSNNIGFIRRTKHIGYTFHRMIILKCLCNSDIKDRCTKVTVSHMNWRRSEHGRLRPESPPSHRGGPDSRRVKSMWDLWWTKLHWDRFFSEFFGFPCQYHSTAALHSHISPGGRTIDPLVVEVQRQSHSIDMNKNKTTVTWKYAGSLIWIFLCFVVGYFTTLYQSKSIFSFKLYVNWPCMFNWTKFVAYCKAVYQH